MIVQTNVFIPLLIPVIDEVGDVGVVIVPPPETTVHNPVPSTGMFPFKEDELEQMVESLPAAAVVGKGLMLKLTESTEAAQAPFEIVQINVFTPTPIPVIPEVGDAGVVIVPVPETSVHIPVPIVATFPASVPVGAQKV